MKLRRVAGLGLVFIGVPIVMLPYTSNHTHSAANTIGLVLWYIGWVVLIAAAITWIVQLLRRRHTRRASI